MSDPTSAPSASGAPNPYVTGTPPLPAGPDPSTAPSPYAATASSVPGDYQPVPTVAPIGYPPYAPYTLDGPAYGYTPRTDPLAITSMVLSLASLLVWITFIPGIILGHVSLGRITRTGEQGRGMAIAGIAVGYAMLGFTVLYVVFLFGIFAFAWSVSS